MPKSVVIAMMMRNPLPAQGAFALARSTPVVWKTAAAWTLACLSMLGMLMAFHAVMRGAVEQAQARHRTLAAHAEATSHCKALHGLRASGECLSRLNAEAPAAAVLQASNLEISPPSR